MEIVRGEQREPYVTQDGSTVREVAGPAPGNASNQSLAEATVPPGARHKLWANEGEPLVLLCCSSPPYSHDDTVLCE